MTNRAVSGVEGRHGGREHDSAPCECDPGSDECRRCCGTRGETHATHGCPARAIDPGGGGRRPSISIVMRFHELAVPCRRRHVVLEEPGDPEEVGLQRVVDVVNGVAQRPPSPTRRSLRAGCGRRLSGWSRQGRREPRPHRCSSAISVSRCALFSFIHQPCRDARQPG